MAVSDHSSMAATPYQFQGFRPISGCMVFVLVIVVSFPAAFCDDESGRVEYLPGFDGPLPFYLETGYIGVGEREEIQLFYYFVKSERDAEKDGLMLWLTEGPGCSAFSGLIYEIGPLKFVIKEYTNGSLPELEVNPHSWTKASSIIFVDSPVGTGFSYATSQRAYRTGDFEQVRDLNHFMRKWLKRHPEFISNQMYVGGDSYSGLTVPPLVQRIADGNANGEKPYVNIQMDSWMALWKLSGWRAVADRYVWLEELPVVREFVNADGRPNVDGNPKLGGSVLWVVYLVNGWRRQTAKRTVETIMERHTLCSRNGTYFRRTLSVIAKLQQ